MELLFTPIHLLFVVLFPLGLLYVCVRIVRAAWKRG
jgi:hypothetical protein